MTKEQYILACVERGSSKKDAENTWELMEAIERVLCDRDVAPHRPPEAYPPHKARLARLFIDRYKAMTLDNDKAIVAWLRSFPGPALVEDDIAKKIEAGEHWKWWHLRKQGHEQGR